MSYFGDVENYLEIEGNLKVVDFFFIKDRKKKTKEIIINHKVISMVKDGKD